MTLLKQTRGDTYVIPTTVTNTPNAGLTGCAFTFTARYFYTDTAAVVTKTPAITSAGGSGASGVITTTIAPADTQGLPSYTVLLVWDIQMVDTTGAKSTVDSGYWRITPDVTTS